MRECVGDRVAGVVEWNLFDIDAKFGDVEPLETVLDYLAAVAPPADAAVDIASARTAAPNSAGDLLQPRGGSPRR